MSYKVAENIGHEKVVRVLELLNDGASLDHIAGVLGCSKSRASRKVNALYKKVWIPKVATEDYLHNRAQSLQTELDFSRKDIAEIEARKAIILPMVRHGKTAEKNRPTETRSA